MFHRFCSWLLFCLVFYKNHPSSLPLFPRKNLIVGRLLSFAFGIFEMTADYLYSAFYCFAYFISISLIPRLICCGVALAAPDLALLDSVTNGVALKLYLCLVLLETCLSHLARSWRFCSGVACSVALTAPAFALFDSVAEWCLSRI